jgi:hypothetical protein
MPVIGGRVVRTLNTGLITSLVFAALLSLPPFAHAQGTVTVGGARGWTESPDPLVLALEATVDLSGFQAQSTYTAQIEVAARRAGETNPFRMWKGNRLSRLGADGKGSITVSLEKADVWAGFIQARYGTILGAPNTPAEVIRDFKGHDFDVRVSITFATAP